MRDLLSFCIARDFRNATSWYDGCVNFIMAEKKRDRRHLKLFALFGDLQQETARGIWAILCLLFAALLILAATESAGVFGVYVFSLFVKLLGIGYGLLPLLLIAGGLFFLRSFGNFVTPARIFGACLFFLSSLALINLLEAGKGGLVGTYISVPLVSLLSTPATLAVLLAAVLIGLLMVIDRSLTLHAPHLRLPRFFQKKSETENSAFTEAVPLPEDEVVPESPERVQEPTAAMPVQGPEKVSRLFMPARHPRGAYEPPPLSLL